ncbi:NfeD family protein [Methylotuvimicrobium buryatense]|uniref:Nodulation protein NfeD n=1 Tax=Methylotuvimicrobium buryatense TaxID=95641 RepID=A0A4P9UPJ4_METBY|nr:nodulation protein NfeD [Methylotuvimicrobium buryatense]QCW83278.1 nodulation protein NfeD [Methylotuvimicrobium buryatense]
MKRHIDRRTVLPLLFVMAMFINSVSAENNQAAIPATPIVQLTIQDAIGPATSDYIERSMDKASESGAKAILITLDTPGGLDTSMRQIIKKIIASPIPVITYVTPGGARAASAGTYILYASHIAAMTPGTNLGAATPVQLIGPTETPGEQPDKDQSVDQTSSSKSPKNAMAQKAINDAVAYIRSLAEMRGRNANWGEQAVREAASLSAEKALELNVIDILATDRYDLLKQLDQRKINVLGRDISLSTDNAAIQALEPDWRSELLAVITNPNIAYILLIAGIYGLIFEFSNPGAIVPGTIGGISLLLALFAFQVLPINYAGFALILLGISLMIAEAFVPSIGILGFGGLTAFVIGSVILMDTDATGFGIDIALVGAFALTSAAFLIFALGMLLKSRQKPIVSGREELLGETGIVLADFTDTGPVRVHSEIWQARSRESLKKNQRIRVIGRDGLILEVNSTPNQEHKDV